MKLIPKYSEEVLNTPIFFGIFLKMAAFTLLFSIERVKGQLIVKLTKNLPIEKVVGRNSSLTKRSETFGPITS
jgi:hypothetical protein